MGLDMYLYARRELDPGPAHDVRALLAKHQDTINRYGPPKVEDDGSIEHYVPAWDYAPHGSDPWRTLNDAAADLLEASGMLQLFDHEGAVGLRIHERGESLHIDVTCAYWRKANAIHDWFVTECQDGVDECQISEEISAEKLAELRDACQRAMAAYDAGDHGEAAILVTPRAGFFFGGTEIDDSYRWDLEDTIRQIERVITTAIQAGGKVTFHYHSSW